MFKSKEEKAMAFFKSLSKDEKVEYLNSILSDEEKEELAKEEKKVEEKKEEKDEKSTKKTSTTKEEVKKQPKQEPVQEVKIDLDAITEQIMGKLEEKFKPYVTKDELEEIKKEIPKAQDFGAEQKNVSTEDNDFEKSRESILNKLN